MTREPPSTTKSANWVRTARVSCPALLGSASRAATVRRLRSGATVQCVPDHELPAANALVNGAENALWIAAPDILGTLTLLGLGPDAVTAVAALLLDTTALCAYAAPLPPPGAAAIPATKAPLVGILLVVRDARVRRPLLVAIGSNAPYGCLLVHVNLLSGTGLNAVFAVGGFMALAGSHRLAGTVRPAAMLVGSMDKFAGAAGTVGLTGAGFNGALAIAVAGTASLVSEVLAVTMLQRAVAETVVARLFGVHDQLNVGAIALGSMLAGPLSMALGVGAALPVIAVACLVAASATASGAIGPGAPDLTRRPAPRRERGQEGRAW
jgi:hypothetical protein